MKLVEKHLFLIATEVKGISEIEINGLPEQMAYFEAKARNMGCEVD